jgi:ATP-dependent DNA helicase DinG
VDRTFVALDLETTGLSPRLDRIIEVGAVRFQGDTVLATFQSLVRPEVGIPRAVQELTGIRDADVAAAPQPEHVLAQLIDFVGTSAVVAHSGNFDLSFLVDGASEPVYELFDTLDLARIMLPVVPSHSLPHLSRQLGLSHPHPHRALSDADAARQLFRYLWQFARGFPADLLDRMLEASRDWPHPIHHFLEEALRACRPRARRRSIRHVPPRPRPTPRRSAPCLARKGRWRDCLTTMSFANHSCR